MKHLFFFIILNSTYFTFAQSAEWVSVTYGFEQDITASSISIDNNGDVVSVGHYEGLIEFPNGETIVGSLSNNALIQKYNSQGEIIWFKDFPGYSPASSVTTDSQNNIYVAGKYNNTVFFDGITLESTFFEKNHYILKLDSNGNVIGAIPVPGLSAERPFITSDSQDNIYVLGEFAGDRNFGGTVLNSSNGRLYLIKFNSNGQYIYVKQMGSLGSTTRGVLKIDHQDNVIVTGSFLSSAVFGGDSYQADIGENAFVVKLTPLGEFLWSRHIIGNSSGTGIAIDSQNNIYISGYYGGDVQFDNEMLSSPNFTSIFVEKFDDSGNKIWLKDILMNSAPSFRKPVLSINESDYLYLLFGFKGELNYEGNLYNATNSQFVTQDIIISNLGDNNGVGELIWAKQFNRINYSNDGIFTTDGNDLYLSAGIGTSQFDGIPIQTGNPTDFIVAKISDNTLSVNDVSSQKTNTFLFHNKFQDNYTIVFNKKVSNLSLEIFNVSGKRIKDINVNQNIESFSFDLNGASGLYFLKLRINNRYESLKLLKK